MLQLQSDVPNRKITNDQPWFRIRPQFPSPIDFWGSPWFQHLKQIRPTMSREFSQWRCLIDYKKLKGLSWWVSAKESTWDARDSGDVGWIPGLARSPGEGKGNPPPVFVPGESPWTEGPGGLQSVRVTKNWTRLTNKTPTKKKLKNPCKCQRHKSPKEHLLGNWNSSWHTLLFQVTFLMNMQLGEGEKLMRTHIQDRQHFTHPTPPASDLARFYLLTFFREQPNLNKPINYP